MEWKSKENKMNMMTVNCTKYNNRKKFLIQ